jgi:hypothetical protein
MSDVIPRPSACVVLIDDIERLLLFSSHTSSVAQHAGTRPAADSTPGRPTTAGGQHELTTGAATTAACHRSGRLTRSMAHHSTDQQDVRTREGQLGCHRPVPALQEV